MPTETPLESACRLAGSQTALAVLLQVKPPSVSEWLKRGRAPEDRCAAIESATGIRCEDLRPDIAWTRDTDGRVTGYHVPVSAPGEQRAA